MSNVTRRKLLKSSGLVLAGAAVTDGAGIRLFGQAPQAQPLDQALLTSAYENIGPAFGRIATGVGSSADYGVVAA